MTTTFSSRWRAAFLALSLVLVLFSFIAAPPPISAVGPTIKWVDQASGSDANDGNTEATAYATLQHALTNTESGLSDAQRSFIYVKDGIYTGTGLSNTCEGINGAVYVHNLDWLTIQAPAGHEPVITPPAGIVSLVVEGSDHLVVDNLDSDQTVALTDNWHVCDSDDLTLRNSLFTGGNDGIDFHTALTVALIENNTFTGIVSGSGDEVLDFTDDFHYSGVVIQDNNFINNYRQITVNPGTGGPATGFIIQRNWMNGTTSQEAIRLINAQSFKIFNNVILNSMQEGIYVDTGSTPIDIVHNTFFNNSQEVGATKYGEIRTNPTDAGITILNNVIHGNGTNPPIVTSVASLPGEDYNLFYNYVLAGSFTTFGANSISGDPLFVDTTAGSEDLHLTDLSPAIEKAFSSPVSDDKDKGPRPNPSGTDPDIGAYENAPTMSQAYFFSAKTTGSVPGAGAFGSEDILMYDGSTWSIWFDGSFDAGLIPTKTYHNIDAFSIPDPLGDDLYISFTRNQRPVPGINGIVDGMDVVHWDGTAFSLLFDGQDVGLEILTRENVDALHVLPGSEWTATPDVCLNYLLISTKGAGNVPKPGSGLIKFSGEDVLGFCLTQAGADTTGLWTMVLDGSTVGMNKGSTDSISLSADGQTLYLTTAAKFTVNGVLLGNKSMVYTYDIGTQTFSGPIFIAPAAGLTKVVDGLHISE